MSPDSNTATTPTSLPDIREAYPLIDDSLLSNEQWTHLWIGLGILLTLALFFALYTWMKRPRPTPELSPIERAQAALQEAESLLKEERLKNFSQTISQALRQYIQDTYRIPALELTTEEFARTLKQRPQLNKAETNQIANILNACDTLKFSPQNVPCEETFKILKEAQAFIDSESAEESEFRQS